MCHDNEKWCKIWWGLDLSIQNWYKEFDEFWPEHSKFSKIWTLITCFWPRYIMLDLKRSTEELFDCTEDWCQIWRQTDLYSLKWHEEFGKFSPEHIRKSKNWIFSWVLLSKVENVWAWNLQGSYVSWEWRMTQNVKRNCLVNSKVTWVIWWTLSQALENLKNLNFNELLLTKVYNAWAKESTDELLGIVRRLMWNLKENWLVISKMTWRIWQIFTRAHLKV